MEQEDDFKTQQTSENNFKAKVIVVMIWQRISDSKWLLFRWNRWDWEIKWHYWKKKTYFLGNSWTRKIRPFFKKSAITKLKVEKRKENLKQFRNYNGRKKKRECQDLKTLSFGSKTLCKGNSTLKNLLMAKFLL